MKSPIVAILLALALAACTQNNPPAIDDALRAQIQRVDDDRQIRDIMAQYGQLLDKGDFAGYSQLFAKNGEWSGLIGGAWGTITGGPAAIQAAMEKQFADRVYDPERITNLHLITNIRIQIEGDRATGYSRWTVFSRNEKDEPYVRLSGRYDDVFVREDGTWKFQSRAAKREIPSSH